MTSDDDVTPEAADRRPVLPRWKKLALAVSLLLAAGGGGYWAYAAATAPAPDGPRAAESTGDEQAPAPGLLPSEGDDSGWLGLPELPGGQSGDGETPDDGGSGSAERSAGGEGEPVWAPAAFRLGFGFFVGFCMGYALRAFLRIALLGAGALLLLLFGLQYAGLIAVDWSAVEGVFTDAGSWLRANLEGLRAFVTGTLPSAAAGLGGALVGFRK